MTLKRSLAKTLSTIKHAYDWPDWQERRVQSLLWKLQLKLVPCCGMSGYCPCRPNKPLSLLEAIVHDKERALKIAEELLLRYREMGETVSKMYDENEELNAFKTRAEDEIERLFKEIKQLKFDCDCANDARLRWREQATKDQAKVLELTATIDNLKSQKSYADNRIEDLTEANKVLMNENEIQFNKLKEVK